MTEKLTPHTHFSVASQSPDLAADIARFAVFLKNAQAEAQSADNKYANDALHLLDWQKPADAIRDAFDHPWEHSPKWEGVDRDVAEPLILEWLDKSNITGLALRAKGYNGWTAAVFHVQHEGRATSEVFRFGSEANDMHHFIMPWNPLLLLPNAQKGIDFENGMKMAFERITHIHMVEPYTPPGLDEFINRHMLAGTPYTVHDHKDLAVLKDGSPIYVDPDSLGFKTPELAEQHKDDQWDPVWQQGIMRAIHENSEKLALPDILRCVREISPGVFATKQSILHPDPFKAYETTVLNQAQAIRPVSSAPR